MYSTLARAGGAVGCAVAAGALVEAAAAPLVGSGLWAAGGLAGAPGAVHASARSRSPPIAWRARRPDMAGPPSVRSLAPAGTAGQPRSHALLYSRRPGEPM